MVTLAEIYISIITYEYVILLLLYMYQRNQDLSH